MANTIKLGARPKTFKPIVVKFQMPDGSDAALEVTYNYVTRTEFGAMVDAMFNDAGAARPEGEQFSMHDLMEKTRNKNAEYLLKCVHSWALDEPVCLESLRQLADEIPAGASAIMDAFRQAALEGRLGN